MSVIMRDGVPYAGMETTASGVTYDNTDKVSEGDSSFKYACF